MSLGQQIKCAREKKKWSQEDLADQLGISRQSVSKWENDTSIPQGINRELLSQVLEISLEEQNEPISIPPYDRKRQTIFCAIGWLIATIFFLLYLFKPQYMHADNSESRAEDFSIQSVTFYDENETIVESEALWYNASNIDSILIQWNGGIPDVIKMFATPSGSDTLDQTVLLLTQSIETGGTAILLNADPLKSQYQSHIFFELTSGEVTVTSEPYNIFSHDTL